MNRSILSLFIGACLSGSALANTVTLLEKDTWGAYSYQDVELLNNQIAVVNNTGIYLDFFDVTLPTDQAFKQSVAIDNYNQLFTFDNNIGISTFEDVRLYSVDDDLTLSEVYRYQFDGVFGESVVVSDTALYVMDRSGDLFVISKTEEGYQASNRIPGSPEYDDATMSYSLAGISDNFAYFLRQYTVDGVFTVKVDEFDLSAGEFVNTVTIAESEVRSMAVIADSTIVFAVRENFYSPNTVLKVVDISSGAAAILSEVDEFNDGFRLSINDGVLHALSANQLVTFSIGEDYSLTKTSEQTINDGAVGDYVSKLVVSGDNTLAIGDSGLLRLNNADGVLTGIDDINNITGSIFKGTVYNDNYLMPRGSNTDVLTVDDDGLISRVTRLENLEAEIIDTINNRLITIWDFEIGDYSLSEDFALTRNSSFTVANAYPVMHARHLGDSKLYLAGADYDQVDALNIYNLTTPYTLAEGADTTVIGNSINPYNTCITSLGALENILISFNQCGGTFELFDASTGEHRSQIDIEDDLLLQLPTYYTQTTAMVMDGVLYLAIANELSSLQFNAQGELEVLSTVTLNNPNGSDFHPALHDASTLLLVGSYYNVSIVDTTDPANLKIAGEQMTDAFSASVPTDVFNQHLLAFDPSSRRTVVSYAFNYAPVAGELSYTIQEDEPLTIASAFSDPEGDAFTVQVVTPPASGELTVTNGKITFSPALNDNGEQTFTVSATDVYQNQQEVTFTVSITPVNDAPVIEIDTVTLNEDSVLSQTLDASDVDDTTLIFALVSQGQFGEASLSESGTLTYTPTADYFGDDYITFSVTDSGNLTTQAELHIVVQPVNDAPVPEAQEVDSSAGSASEGTLTAEDVESDALTFSLVEGPAHGVVNLNEDGSYSYTPSSEYNGTDSFTYSVSDGTNSTQGSVSFTVTGGTPAKPVTSQPSKSGGGGGTTTWWMIAVLFFAACHRRVAVVQKQ